MPAAELHGAGVAVAVVLGASSVTDDIGVVLTCSKHFFWGSKITTVSKVIGVLRLLNYYRKQSYKGSKIRRSAQHLPRQHNAVRVQGVWV